MTPGSTPEGRPEFYIGLMSGTSLDGVDAVLADFTAPRLLATHYLPYGDSLTGRLLALQDAGADELRRAALLGIELAGLYAEASRALLDKANLSPQSVVALGCHGQTVRHAPEEGYSLQLGNPALLAELSGITVVADFRSRDIAAGGQGAPLVPAFHEALFGSDGQHRVVLNLGGMANVSNLAPAAATTGFDTGPGNVLIDAWSRRHIGQPYDRDGAWAASGRILPQLLESLLAHPYFSSAPPKSCGREQFNLEWLESLPGVQPAAPADIQATLLELTAGSIGNAIERWCGQPEEVIVCGGGAHNRFLLQRLAAHLPQAKILDSEAWGVGPDWVEAMAFAWLARQTMRGKAASLPAVTGAKGARVLGAIYPA